MAAPQPLSCPSLFPSHKRADCNVSLVSPAGPHPQNCQGRAVWRMEPSRYRGRRDLREPAPFLRQDADGGSQAPGGSGSWGSEIQPPVDGHGSLQQETTDSEGPVKQGAAIPDISRSNWAQRDLGTVLQERTVKNRAPRLNLRPPRDLHQTEPQETEAPHYLNHHGCSGGVDPHSCSLGDRLL